MRRPSRLARVGVPAALSVALVLGPVGSGSAAAAAGTPAPATPTSVAPASTAPAAGPAPGSPHVLTRTERGLLLVTLTFLVGAGLLGTPDTEDNSRDPKRPAITLYDDPALVGRDAPPRRPVGEPPPLR